MCMYANVCVRVCMCMYLFVCVRTCVCVSVGVSLRIFACDVLRYACACYSVLVSVCGRFHFITYYTILYAVGSMAVMPANFWHRTMGRAALFRTTVSSNCGVLIFLKFLEI